MDLISEGYSILLLHSNENIKENIINKFNDIKANFNNITFVAESFKEREEKKNQDKSKFDIIICTTINFIDDNGMIKIILEVLKPNGIFELHSITSNATAESAKKHLKLSGFIEIQDSTDNAIQCKKPNYEIGSSVKLLLKPQPPKSINNVAAIWTINGDDDNDDDDDYNNVIDADDLLDDIDKQKPDPITLKVCSTTGKRKACKDCSCGLAEELDIENSDSDNIKASKNKNELKSSCGSCYLGDAFRCASCPYLGMPAFKPGEKIQLSDDLLKSDI